MIPCMKHGKRENTKLNFGEFVLFLYKNERRLPGRRSGQTKQSTLQHCESEKNYNSSPIHSLMQAMRCTSLVFCPLSSELVRVPEDERCLTLIRSTIRRTYHVAEVSDGWYWPNSSEWWLLCVGTQVQLIDSNPEMEELHQQQSSVTNYSVINQNGVVKALFELKPVHPLIHTPHG